MFLRAVAFGSAAGVVCMVAVTQVPDQTRLPLSAVVPGAEVTQPFGCTTLDLEPFDPFCPAHHVHTGVDLAAPLGTAVFAATAGVASVGYDPAGAGLFVAVTFDGDVRLLYCHLLETDVVTGEQIRAGMRIGEVGATGLATGPHVHFQVDVGGRYVDPGRWLEG